MYKQTYAVRIYIEQMYGVIFVFFFFVCPTTHTHTFFVETISTICLSLLCFSFVCEYLASIKPHAHISTQQKANKVWMNADEKSKSEKEEEEEVVEKENVDQR